MSIATNSLRTYLFRFGNGFLGFLIGILISRLLGPTGKGQYGSVFIYYALYLNIFSNLGAAITYQVSKQRQPPRKTFLTATGYSLLIGLVTILLFAGLNNVVSFLQVKFLWFVVILVPFVLVLNNLSGLFQGLNRILELNWLSLLSGLIQTLLLGSFYLYTRFTQIQPEVFQVVLIWFIGQVITLTLGFMIGKEFWQRPQHQEFSLPLLTAMLGFGWQISLNNMIGYLNSRIDSLVVQWLLPVQKFGLYSVSINGAEILWYASGAIAIAICAYVGNAEKDQAASLTAKAVRHTLLINTPIAAVMWAGAWILPAVYGTRFTASMVPFKTLLPGVLAYSVAGIFSTYFTNQLGKPRISLLVASFALLIDFIGSICLIPKIGMIGGAIANSISYLMAVGLLVILFCRETKMSLWQLLMITSDDIADYQMLWQNIMRFIRRRNG